VGQNASSHLSSRARFTTRAQQLVVSLNLGVQLAATPTDNGDTALPAVLGQSQRCVRPSQERRPTCLVSSHSATGARPTGPAPLMETRSLGAQQRWTGLETISLETGGTATLLPVCRGMTKTENLKSKSFICFGAQSIEHGNVLSEKINFSAPGGRKVAIFGMEDLDPQYFDVSNFSVPPDPPYMSKNANMCYF